MASLPWLCPLDAPYNAVGNSVYGLGGGADDTAAILACVADCIANKKKMYLPGGHFFRITQDIARTATAVGYQRGLSIFGDGMMDGGIVADYNGDSVKGAVLRYDTSVIGGYTVESELSNFSISKGAGRTGLNGIQLTAAWLVSIDRVKVDGLSGRGLIASLRTDIDPTVSDSYQAFSVRLNQIWVSGCSGWGIDFGAGQSPGLYELKWSAISGNAGGGIRSTTGQCEIGENLIVGNGSYGGEGGLLFDTAEGPSMVAHVYGNEFDTNFSYHINLIRSRDLLLERNRFLSQTFDSNTGSVFTVGTPFMRPLVHVNMQNQVWNLTAQKNFHRSVNGRQGTPPVPTTADCYAYDASVGAVIPDFPCRFTSNDFGFGPFDGLAQNSTGLRKYVGLGAGTGAVIIDP